ncbi:MAG: adenylate kinase [Bryobacteraceae bacterium]
MAQLCLILFGAPGSGKGTQAKLLQKTMGLPQISTGDMLRESVERGDDLGEEIRAILKSGALVSDEMVNALVEERISRHDCEKGFILDGYPRTVAQAGTVDTLLKSKGIRAVVVHLKVDYNVIVARLADRRLCSVCGALYGIAPGATATPSVCSLDGSKLVVREDDRPEVVTERLKAYDAKTAPVLEYFRKAGYMCLDVDGNAEGGPAVVAAGIRGLLAEAAGAGVAG